MKCDKNPVLWKKDGRKSVLKLWMRYLPAFALKKIVGVVGAALRKEYSDKFTQEKSHRKFDSLFSSVTSYEHYDQVILYIPKLHCSNI